MEEAEVGAENLCKWGRIFSTALQDGPSPVITGAISYSPYKWPYMGNWGYNNPTYRAFSPHL